MFMAICVWVDCDEVLSETMDEILKLPLLKEKNIKKSDITSYELSEVEKIWITSKEAVKLFFSFFESQEYWQTQPVFGAYEKLYELKKLWCDLYVVTARSKMYKSQTKKRVETHFPWIFSDYLFMWQYTENEIPKSQLCKDRWIQVLIDDNTFNIYDMNGVWIPWFLLDKPWNQWIKNSNLLYRVFSRDEIDLSHFFKHLEI